MIVQALSYLMLVNLAAYGAFAYDKAMAVGGQHRIPERHLLTLAFIGGSLGAVAAQQIIRHKTRKEPFRTHLLLIVGLQIVALLVVAVAGIDRAAHWTSS